MKGKRKQTQELSEIYVNPSGKLSLQGIELGGLREMEMKQRQNLPYEIIIIFTW